MGVLRKMNFLIDESSTETLFVMKMSEKFKIEEEGKIN